MTFGNYFSVGQNIDIMRDDERNIEYMDKRTITCSKQALISNLNDINDKIKNEDILLDEISNDIEKLIEHINYVHEVQLRERGYINR